MSASTATTSTITLPGLHRGQEIVLASPARFKWLDAGRRWFKTSLDLNIAVEGALVGKEILWGAPTYDQVRVGWNEMRRACGNVVTFNETRLEARFPTGGLVRFRSLDDPDNARGFTADEVILDEAAFIPERAWYEIIRPMLMTTRGNATINGTPSGRNWFYRECLRAHAGDAADSVAWIEVPTLGAKIDTERGELVRVPHPMENPRIAWDEIVQMYETLPERVFRQEILAEFLDDAGGVFRGVRACIGGALKSGPEHVTEPYVMGVDLAKMADYTVCVVMDARSRQVVAFDRFNRADWGLQKQRIAALAAHWNNALIWMDATGVGDPVYDDLHAAGLRVSPYKFTAATKQTLINNAVLLVEQGQVRYPDIPALIGELTIYEYSKTAAGTTRMNAPEGQHDDCVIAFALACWPLAGGGGAFGASEWAELLRGGMRGSDAQRDRYGRLVDDGRTTQIGGVNILRKRF